MEIRKFVTPARTAAIAAGFALAFVGGCADGAGDVAGPSPDDTLGFGAAELGSVLDTCSSAGSSGYDASTKTLALALTGSVNSVVLAVVDKELAINHNPCVDSSGTALTTTTVQKITVAGTTGDDEVIIDMAPGAFGQIFTTKGGITIDLGAGTGDAVKIRGSNSGTDRMTAGESGGIAYFDLSGDKKADVKAENAETFVLALGDGNDTFTGEGGAVSADHLTSSITTLSAFTADLTVNGGEGNDTITGGNGDDVLSGGEGDYTFNPAAAADGADTYNGGAGTDTMDYSARTGDLTVTLDGTANDGLAAETDDVEVDVENITGGSGDDDLTGSNISNTIKGGSGDDAVKGGTGNADCTLDVDVLEGGDGDDTFDAGSASNCGDKMVGGAGTDLVTYTSRTNDLVISINNKADDGEASEEDNVRSDVEQITGGSGDDTITGSSGDDTIDGGAGDDTLNGGSGDDVFSEGSATSGADIMNGGNGKDTVDYSARTNDLTITLCVDSTALTGDSAAGDCATKNDGEASETDQIINSEHILGGAGDDNITGAESDDTLEGRAGDDTIAGGAGADSIFGDDDDDTLTGGAGDDYIDGGDGTDTGDGEAGDGDICTQVTASNCEL